MQLEKHQQRKIHGQCLQTESGKGSLQHQTGTAVEQHQGNGEQGAVPGAEHRVDHEVRPNLHRWIIEVAIANHTELGLMEDAQTVIGIVSAGQRREHSPIGVYDLGVRTEAGLPAVVRF